MSDHSFNPFMAKKYGVIEAILINNSVFWTRTNAAKPADENNFHDGRYWFYGTPAYFSKYFPYLTENQIKYALGKLMKAGALIKGNYNKKGYDKTNWYTLSDNLLFELNLDRTCLQPASGLIGQNCTMDKTNLHDGSDKFARPIPDTKPDTKQDICEGEDSTQHTIQKLKKEKAEAKALQDEKIQALFKQKFSGRNVRLEDLFAACQEHYEQKSLWATSKKFMQWVEREKIENYPKIGAYNDKPKSKGGYSLDVLYSQYFNDLKSQITIKLKPADTYIMTFEEWKCQHEKNASEYCSKSA